VALNQKKRRAIIEAAIGCFVTQGASATRMDEIAEKAEVSKRTLYNHFASKRELFDEVTDNWRLQWLNLAIEPFDPNQAIKPQLLAIAQCKLALLQDPRHIELARLVIGEALHDPQLAAEQMAKFDLSEDKLVAWLEQAVAAGALKPLESVFAAQQFWGQIKTFSFWPQVIGHSPCPTAEQSLQICQHAVELFLARYKEQ